MSVDKSPPADISIQRFLELVKEWNQQFDLTAAKNDEALWDIFFEDAIQLHAIEPKLDLPQKASILDVGTGAGAPALSWALLAPQHSFTLIEPLKKRTFFLNLCIKELGLENRVTVLESKIAALTSNPDFKKTRFDLAMSRATFSPEDWLKLGRKLAPKVLVFGVRDVPGSSALQLEHHYNWKHSLAPRTIGYYSPAVGSGRTPHSPR